MDRSDASALADLQMHWDEAYVIRLDGNIWSARFRDSADELRAHTSSELREQIRCDYAYRQRAGLASRDPDGDIDDNDDDGTADDDDGTADDDDGTADARDRSDAARQYAAEVNFAAIRGERMST